MTAGPYWHTAEVPGAAELLAAMGDLDRARPLVLVPPGALTPAQLDHLATLGAEVRESDLAPAGHLLWVNRGALDRAMGGE